MAERGAERGGESASTMSASPMSPPQVRASGLTSRQLRAHVRSSDAASVGMVRLGSIAGGRICLPGVSKLRDGWSVPGQYLVGALVGTFVFMVGDDGSVDARGQQHRVSAVVVSRYGCIAPSSFQLCECADEHGLVSVVCGAHVAEFVGMPFVESEPMDLSEVKTPPSPGSP